MGEGGSIRVQTEPRGSWQRFLDYSTRCVVKIFFHTLIKQCVIDRLRENNILLSIDRYYNLVQYNR